MCDHDIITDSDDNGFIGVGPCISSTNTGLMDIEELGTVSPPVKRKSFMVKPHDNDFSINDKVHIIGAVPIPHKLVEDQVKMRAFVTSLYDLVPMIDEGKNHDKVKMQIMRQLMKKHRINPSISNILYTYRTMLADKTLKNPSPAIEKHFQFKTVRKNSGVMVITVVLSPHPDGQDFSCKFDCHYCPSEPEHEGNNWQDQPRSYIFNEPGVRRANRNKFDPILQFRDRARAYIVNGLPVDKVELIILGGTWDSYPEGYRERFVRDLYYAANTLWDIDFNETPREKLDVPGEHKLNESSKCRIIGLTIETRPDQITGQAIRHLRYLGTTRVQLGVQHTDDGILKKINRQCKTWRTIAAIKMLKDCCFKVDIHLMPDLPSSSYELDMQMFCRVLETEDFQVDQWKIYPCMTVPWTKIKEWYDAGEYEPYAESVQKLRVKKHIHVQYNSNAFFALFWSFIHWFLLTVFKYDNNYEWKDTNPLFELIMEVKSRVHPWIRLNRVIRDIPDEYMVNIDKIDCAGFSNMRQWMQAEMKKRGLECKCIRCREVKGKITDLSNSELVVRSYKASGGDEYFISYEDVGEDILYGFLRLRLSDMAGQRMKGSHNHVKKEVIFPELVGSALIRELHVYGAVTEVTENKSTTSNHKSNAQHVGFGTKLLAEAERISIENGYNKISVISGVGVRDYYRKKGYVDDQSFLNKKIG
jgi:histone acetyltransferase (RNA polymerase elongator complex component)